MTRLQETFTKLRASGETAFIPFITAGYPSLAKTRQFVRALEAGGADIIELGMPFSDPMADGPVIQAADEVALAAGTTLQDILDLVATLRRETETPIVLMGYYNPIFHYGVNRFARAARQAGVDGCLIADLPVEEAAEVQRPFDRNKIDLIYLLSPTSNGMRIQRITRKGRGYLYYVSMTGITGAKLSAVRRIGEHVKGIRRWTDLPLAVGFGISSSQQARQIAHFADAVVVGSAFVKRIGAGAGVREIETMARKFKRAIA